MIVRTHGGSISRTHGLRTSARLSSELERRKAKEHMRTNSQVRSCQLDILFCQRVDPFRLHGDARLGV